MSERRRNRHKTKRWKYDAQGSKIKGGPTSPRLPQDAESTVLEMKDWSPASPLKRYFTYIVWHKFFWLLLFQRTTKNSSTSLSLPCLFWERLPESFYFFIGPCVCQAWDNIPGGSSPSAMVGGCISWESKNLHLHLKWERKKHHHFIVSYVQINPPPHHHCQDVLW